MMKLTCRKIQEEKRVSLRGEKGILKRGSKFPEEV
jgi:hypothetical protein